MINSARKAHHAETASWFFQGSTFKLWKSSPSLLWIHGDCTFLFLSTAPHPLTPIFVAGSGKSVLWFVILCYSCLHPLRLLLSSGIIEDIMAQRQVGSAIVAYFYCDFSDKDKQNCRNIVLSIISQLCAQSDRCCQTLSRHYSAQDSAQNTSEETLTTWLTEMVSLPDQGSIYLVVDALDECPDNSGMPTPRETVLNFVKNLVSLRLPNLHVCVTSRPGTDIQAVLEPLTSPSLRVSLHDHSGQQKDIEDYIRFVVYSDPKMRKWGEGDRKLVVEKLSKRADGM